MNNLGCVCDSEAGIADGEALKLEGLLSCLDGTTLLLSLTPVFVCLYLFIILACSSGAFLTLT